MPGEPSGASEPSEPCGVCGQTRREKRWLAAGRWQPLLASRPTTTTPGDVQESPRLLARRNAKESVKVASIWNRDIWILRNVPPLLAKGRFRPKSGHRRIGRCWPSQTMGSRPGRWGERKICVHTRTSPAIPAEPASPASCAGFAARRAERSVVWPLDAGSTCSLAGRRYAPSHRQDNTYHGLCYTSRGALAGTRNSSLGPLHEESIRRPIAPWANALTTELHLAPIIYTEWMWRRLWLVHIIMWQWWLVQILWHIPYVFSSFCCLMNYYTVTFATCWYMGWV